MKFKFETAATMMTAMAGAALLAAPAMAQQAAPGAPTREELRPDQRLAPAQPGPSRLTVDGGIEHAPCPLADPSQANVVVNFTDVRFNGLGPISPDALRDSWSDQAGHDVPVAILCTIRDRAATALRAMGYLAAVQLPPQRIEKGGTISFDILMAKLVGIEVRGDAGHSEKLIAALLEKLKDEPLFNMRQAERTLLLARDLPGYDVRLTLRPTGTAPGEVIGLVQVARQQLRVDANVQNWGSHNVGRFGGLLRAQINDITGMGDSTTLALFNTFDTREQTVLQAGHSMALGVSGLRGNIDFSYAWSRPDVLNGGLKSETMILTAGLSYPLIRRQTTSLLLSGGIDFVDQDVEALGVPLTRDRLRVLFARAEADLIDPGSLASTDGWSAAAPRWRIGGYIEARHGLSGLGASEGCGPAPIFAGCLPPDVPPSRITGDPSAFVLRAGGNAQFRPFPKLTISIAPRAQYSPDPLLSFEEASAGNYTVGRGYDPGSLIGDSAVGYSYELRYGSLQPRGERDLALEPFAFFDAMWVWNHDAPDSRLYSTGAGVRGQWGRVGRFDMTLAMPLRNVAGHERGDWRLLLSFTAQLLPWSR